MLGLKSREETFLGEWVQPENVLAGKKVIDEIIGKHTASNAASGTTWKVNLLIGVTELHRALVKNKTCKLYRLALTVTYGLHV